jgi:hypothetical protein
MSPGPNSLPVLSDASFVGAGPTAAAEIDYLDADGHCPVLSEIVFDDADTFALHPQSTDYSSQVAYRSDEGIAPLSTDSWTSAVFRFSDNLSEVVEHSETNTGIDHAFGDVLAMGLAPNPITPSTSATVHLNLPESGRIEVSVYDLRGARVARLVDRYEESGPLTIRWSGRNDEGRAAASGIYFVRAAFGDEYAVDKLVLLR